MEIIFVVCGFFLWFDFMSDWSLNNEHCRNDSKCSWFLTHSKLLSPRNDVTF